MGLRLRVRSTGESSGADAVYEFDQSRVVIGRGGGADVRLPHPSVSATHATIRTHDVGYVVVDEGSTNGTRVGETRVVPGRPKALRSGDVIGIGTFALRFDGGMPVAVPTSAERTGALARQLVREVLEGPDELAPPRLVVLDGPNQGSSLELPPPPAVLRIGRGEECDLVLQDADASREHVELERDLEGVVARDLGSKNGLLVNGRPVQSRRLRDRDELLVGATALAFEEPADAKLRALDELEDEGLDEAPSMPAFDEDAEGEDDGSGQEPGAAEAAEPAGQGELAEQAEPAAEAASAGDEAAAGPPGRRRRGASADLLIYALAAVVLAVSIAGLVMLLRAG